MAGERTLPGLGLTAFWTLGSDGWKDGMDANLRKLSALVQPIALSRTTTLPGSPSDGDIYIVPEDAVSNANEIAIRDNGAWVYLVAQEGWQAYVADTNENVQFDGTDWAALSSGGGGGSTTIRLSFFAGGLLGESEVIFRDEATELYQLPAGLTGSRASSGEAATGETVCSVQKNGAEVGTLTWAASGTAATLAMASATSFSVGDILEVVSPATPDATLADVSGTFQGALL